MHAKIAGSTATATDEVMKKKIKRDKPLNLKDALPAIWSVLAHTEDMWDAQLLRKWFDLALEHFDRGDFRRGKLTRIGREKAGHALAAALPAWMEEMSWQDRLEFRRQVNIHQAANELESMKRQAKKQPAKE
jgi:hypothetical protein